MARVGSQRARELQKRLGLSNEHLLGLRFAINVGIASGIVWYTLKAIADTNPLWAIASMVAASDPQPIEARRMFKSRLINVVVGCATGLVFVVIGTDDWLLPLALATTVLISSFFVRIKTMWRQAPITAAVVIAAAITSGSSAMGIERGLHKVLEVLFGSFVGLLVSLLMSKVWLIDLNED